MKRPTNGLTPAQLPLFLYQLYHTLAPGLTRWYGAAARSVASTARRFTLSPLGSMGLMYLRTA